MSRQSVAGYPITSVGYNNCVVCHYCKNKYLVRTIVNNWRYCKAYKNQCIGDDETEKVEQEKKRRDQRINMYQQVKSMRKDENRRRRHC